MADTKRYYWLKLQDDFFKSKRIKKLRKIAGGDTFTIIYLKMQLLAMKNGGMLEYTGIEATFAEELALDLDEEPENVSVTVNFLLSCGLLETSDNKEFFVPYAVLNTGSEGASARRVRAYREQKALQCNTDVTPVKQICNGEKEIEKEIDIEDISSSLRSEDMGGGAPSEPKDPESGKRTAVKFVPPTLEEVEAYAASRQSTVDPRRFFEYFNTPDAQGRSWRDSKGNPVKNWKQKFLTWEGRDGGKGKPAPAASRTDKPRKSWTELAAEMDAEEGRT